MTRDTTAGLSLPLMEAFYTVQGEGFHAGKPAYFVRIGGCDVGCHWCDVKESWNPEMHPVTPVDDIVKNAIEYSETVIVTGGEPLMWNMIPLTNKLRDKNIKIHLETSGVYTFTGVWDWVCLSPKKRKQATPIAYEKADELKVIVYNGSDFDFAELQAENVSKECKLYLQPEWSRQEKIIPKIVDFVLKNPKWNISLQTHKFMRIP
ncbi:7-carboxy-7-deazaguanine synthase [Elysia marginata]|uniref:7-carboxy-7-deazaguanine synthase n=1 Tax=Elysia marginata TaxID=1093978 RepID=A0AAV4F1S5_9GAST|nr:7-carboxy-7-deazaguanine synthase [Elysia marginata]